MRDDILPPTEKCFLYSKGQGYLLLTGDMRFQPSTKMHHLSLLSVADRSADEEEKTSATCTTVRSETKTGGLLLKAAHQKDEAFLLSVNGKDLVDLVDSRG